MITLKDGLFRIFTERSFNLNSSKFNSKYS
jgi:hypothetical protein